MPFGLTNAPSTFQSYINSTLQEHFDVFCTAYLDDVLIYSNSREEHRKHVNLALNKLRDAGLQLDIKKCQFESEEIKYLGLIISRRGIEMDSVKIYLVLRHKLGANLTSRIKKAIVVARDFEQQAGIEYFDTFASVVRYNTLRTVLALTATTKLEIDSIDINTVFLNPPLKEETYLELPPYFEVLDPLAKKTLIISNSINRFTD
ncbi:hypothetical protein K3495_g3255 [Podosphaera aphanis]|nr:hypothetical protein K3495_g3255 [Podosphaera aphanis]